MKTFLILILSLALLGSAFFTRPTEADFRQYVAEQVKADSGNLLDQFLSEGRSEDLIEGSTFRDRYLWVTVERDGRTVYTGAFAHWFDHGDLKEKVDAAKRAKPLAERALSDALKEH